MAQIDQFWQVEFDGEVHEVDREMLEHWIAEGKVSPSHKVRRGSLRWIEIRSVPILMAAIPPQGAGLQSFSNTGKCANTYKQYFLKFKWYWLAVIIAAVIFIPETVRFWGEFAVSGSRAKPPDPVQTALSKKKALQQEFEANEAEIERLQKLLKSRAANPVWDHKDCWQMYSRYDKNPYANGKYMYDPKPEQMTTDQYAKEDPECIRKKMQVPVHNAEFLRKENEPLLQERLAKREELKKQLGP